MARGTIVLATRNDDVSSYLLHGRAHELRVDRWPAEVL
jgi:hypothetical protein